MKTRLRNCLALAVAMLASVSLTFVSCEKDKGQDNGDGGDQQGTFTPVAKFEVKCGYERAEISVAVSDANTSKVEVYWFPDNTEIITIDNPVAGQEYPIVLGPEEEHQITEDEYTLKAVAYGKNGEKSEIVSVPMNIYGPEYEKTLTAREADIVIDEANTSVKVTFKAPVNATETGVEMKYTDKNGAEQTKYYANDELSEPIVIEVDNLESLAEYRSVYLPEPTALDEVNSAPVKISGFSKVNVALGKAATSKNWFMSMTADKAVDGKMYTDDTRWVNDNSKEGDTWLEVDLGEIHTIYSYQVYIGGNVNGTGELIKDGCPAWEFQVLEGETWKTVDSQPYEGDPGRTFEFSEPIKTSKVRIYIPDGHNHDGKKNMMRLYELEVYSLM